PHVRLYVVGQQPSRRVRELTRDPRIVVTGFVLDVQNFLASATVFVAPLRYGSGTRLKILEAMAMARPVVATSLACEGLELHHGQPLIGPTSPASSRGAGTGLLRPPRSGVLLGEAARQHVLRSYTWSGIQQRLLDIYDTLHADCALVEG